MDREDVAIVGAACLLPGAASLDALHDNLWAGRDSVRQPPLERIEQAGGVPDAGYVSMGYLDRIDLFDHQFFGISAREAELMDPAQRLTLQLVHQAIENSGRAPRDLRGSRTAVILSGTESGYGRLSEESDPQQILGLLPAAMAARISYLLDLVGVALVLDTACSGSMTAIALAVQQLRSGNARMAIAGGVNAIPILVRRQTHVPMRGVESPDGRCRPFDAAANGAVGGEGGGIVILKLLSHAVADADNILAVLKGIATNHNGFRAASMSAPSQLAQTETITLAWQDAGVDPRTIGYVECHGTGTPLGDVVEVEALRQAFLDAGVAAPGCAIGSVKSNVGHLDHAAGMAGLFKALLSVREGVLYPTPHFHSPNPLIDFTGPVYVNPTARVWTTAGGVPRRAGVSSFGLTGTNVHAVLEQPPKVDRPAPDEPSIGELVTISAKSPGALREYCLRLADFAERTEHSVRTVAYACNRCRDDYPYRLAVTATSTTELAAALRSATVPDRPAARDPLVVLLFSGDGRLADAAWLDETGQLGTGTAMNGATPDPARQLVARQHALYRMARSLGLSDTRLAGSGAGNLAVRLCRGDLSREEALGAAAGQPISADVDRARLGRMTGEVTRDGAVLVEMAADGVLSREIRRLAPSTPIVPLAAGAGYRGLLAQLGRIYECGATIDWDRHYEGVRIPLIAAPTYPFEPVRCWCRPPGAAVPSTPATTGAVPAAPIAGGADTERRVAEVWARVLKATGIGTESNYFELGGTSIAGITVLRELEQAFGITLTFAHLYEHPTLRQLASAVDGLRSAAPGGDDDLTITPIPRGGRLPLSFGQEQLWYLDQLNPGTPLYNVPHAIRWRGPLDHAALKAAMVDLAGRHEVMRTRIGSHDGEPYALDAGLMPGLPLVDLSTWPEADRGREAGRVIEAEATEPIDLEHGPLVRTRLLRLAADDHVLLDTWHHGIFDGWSPLPFFRDLIEFYLARVSGRSPDLPDLPIQYADFAAWHGSWLTGERLERGLAYWRERLAGLRRDELPIDRPRPSTLSHAGDLIQFTVAAGLSDRVRAFSRQEGVTTFVTMLAVVDTLIHRWAGWTDVVVGVGTSGRFNSATHDLIGYFNNVLPFRTEVRGGESFRELVRRATTTVAGVLDHEWVPLGKVVSALSGRRDSARHPLFDIAYTHQNAPSPTSTLPGVELSLFDTGERGLGGIPPGTAKFDLTLGITDQVDGPMHAYVEYATALFDRSTMERLATWFETLISATLDSPDDPIADLPLPGPGTSSGRSPSRGATRQWPQERLAVDMVQAHVAQRPEHLAVVCGGRRYTYREVNRRANRLARRLREAGVTAEVVVPVLAQRDVDLVVGWLAVVKAGGGYVPIDPTVPAARVADILGQVDAQVVVVSAGLAELAAGAPRRLVIEAAGADDGTDDVDPPRRAGAGNLAYLTYTSGSTGYPHGCQVDHGSLANLLNWYRDEGGLGPDDRFSQLVSPGFDAAVLEVWAGLCSGATIHFADARQEPGALLRWMAEHQITVAMLPTPLAEIVLTEATIPSDLRLRLLYVGGDRLHARPPASATFRVVNMYGPTECAVVSTAGDVGAQPREVLPDIGRPIPNTAAYLLDRRGEPVPPGEVGELYLGGAGVGRGYHRLAGLTAARFVADPFATQPGARMYRTGDLARLRPDQTIEFLGRADDQVEIRGNRVEPAEIERTLVTHPLVREAVVVPVAASDGSAQLVAYVAGGPPAPTDRELLTWTARTLPAYLVPSRVLVRDTLPRTPNGKLDRKGMKALVTAMTTDPIARTTNASARPADHAGRAERVLAGIWADLLGHDHVGPHDNFFELGGDSVMGVRVAARAAKAGIQLTPQQLLRYHTLRELAEAAGLADVPAAFAQDGAFAPDAAFAPDSALALDSTFAPGGVFADTLPPDPVVMEATVPARPRPAPEDTPIRLTPIMHRFLSAGRQGFADFVVPLVLETTENLDGDTVRAAVEHLVAVHEPLRYRFRANALGWRIECARAEQARFVDVKVLAPMTEEEAWAAVETDFESLKSEVDIERGPTLRVRYYDRGRSRNGLILMVIHHGVFDNMAGIAVLDDLDEALATLTTGRRPVPVPRPTTWREWANHLHHMALSDELAGELEYWTAVARAGATVADTGGRPDREQGGVVIRTIGLDQIAPALAKAGEAGRDTAFCAMACGIARWRGTPDAYLMTEGEATPNRYRTTSRAPAVGWFTTLHPLLLPVEPGASAPDCLAEITDRIRSVPNDGVGYGILRHLSPDSSAVAGLRTLPEPEILVNHMATGTASFDRGIQRLRVRFDLQMKLKKGDTAGFAIVLTSWVHEGSFSLGLAHDGRFTAEEMNTLADHIMTALLKLA